MVSISSGGTNGDCSGPRKQVILNAFAMSTIGHMSPGQWKDPKDRSAESRKLSYWTDLAKILEKGDITALFLADTTGYYETYEGKADECVRRAAQFPVTDPTIPISAMAAVTKNLGFGVTASTTFEPPFLLAKKFSTLDHMTDGRVAWNIVTSYKKSAFKAVGIDSPIEHGERYAQADEYMEVVYKLWESSWSDRSKLARPETDEYWDPSEIREINHHGKYYNIDTRHIVDPSPQRTPFLFQAGTSPAGSAFSAKHAEAIFVQGTSPETLKPKIDTIREIAAKQGRDPASVKFLCTFTPILGRTDEEAREKFQKLRQTASTIGGLVLFSGWTGIDISKIPLDRKITEEDSTEASKVTSAMKSFTTSSKAVPELTPRVVAEKAAIGGMSPLTVGTPSAVADEMERWMVDAGVDGFNITYVSMPGTFEDVVELLVPELRRRGLYPEKGTQDGLTLREKTYGRGQSKLRDDHAGSAYKYDSFWKKQPASATNGAAQPIPEWALEGMR
ncbi:Dimethyl-sulfide monooxygenase [Lecanosticta acicola]|uniref:Dimethyl-sulfide monooxygenase n=1 Tax=Lecanosticta acicola TaxID=111012 RepID=A0AAI8W158_9PEZI|nr:Dimethyl-sulfide monooxygenase [Lecanosticta acicola]